MPTYIVLWTEISNYDRLFTCWNCGQKRERKEVNDQEEHLDHWRTMESYEEALQFYEALLDQGDRIITSSIVVPIKSTDYEEVIINV